MTGCDIATNWLAQARRSAAAEGLSVVFEEGDAEALPYENGTFDAVVSLIAAMFAPRPERGRSRAYPRVPARRDHRDGQLDGRRVRWADV